jgi:hypothetical protein
MLAARPNITGRSSRRPVKRRPGVNNFLQDYWPELMIAIGTFASCLALLLPWA